MGLNSYLKICGILTQPSVQQLKFRKNSSNGNCVAIRLTGIELDQYISTEICLN